MKPIANQQKHSGYDPLCDHDRFPPQHLLQPKIDDSIQNRNMQQSGQKPKRTAYLHISRKDTPFQNIDDDFFRRPIGRHFRIAAFHLCQNHGIGGIDIQVDKYISENRENGCPQRAGKP